MTHPIIGFIEARLAERQVMVDRAAGSFMQGVESSDEEAWLWLADQPGPEVPVLRAILAEHQPDEVALDLDYDEPGICTTCYDETFNEQQYPAHLNHWPCQTVRLLASLWGDHPEYQVEWRPDLMSEARTS